LLETDPLFQWILLAVSKRREPMQDHCQSPSMLVPILFVIVIGAAYVLLARKQRASARGWDGWRTLLFATGCALLILGFSPQVLPFGEGDFRKHMLQHLLLAMLAPTGLVMAAPLTLLLCTLPARYAKMITSALCSSWVAIFSTPVVALVLNLGGMALTFTHLYTAMMMHPALHYLVHVHFVAAGCLYTWVIAGPDPAPHRPSVPVRLVILAIAVVIHSVLAQMLFAGWHVAVPAPPAQLQHAAVLMYYGGDIAEMLLAFALVTTWYPVAPKRQPTVAH
jgi:putative membrane protein